MQAHVGVSGTRVQFHPRVVPRRLVHFGRVETERQGQGAYIQYSTLYTITVDLAIPSFHLQELSSNKVGIAVLN